MCSIPGSTGLPIISDKSYEFYKDPINFVQTHISKSQSRIFKARFLNKTTVFVGSNKGVQDVLQDENGCLDLGYASFMSSVYGDNILFMNGVSALNMRLCLSPLFSSNAVCSYHQTANRIINKHLDALNTTCPVVVYKSMKSFTTELCLALFLNIDSDQSPMLSLKIEALTTKHWHGIIALPMTIKIPLLQNTSYAQAMEAKESLLKVIREKLKNNDSNKFLSQVRAAKFPTDDLSANHILLFTSALIPKALASILTSFIITTGNQTNNISLDRLRSDKEYLDNVVKEILRMYPAFVGGRRLVRQNCTIDGHLVEKDSALLYLTHTAQRDPAVFDKPDQFMPERWTMSMKSKDILFNFGHGPRKCIGDNFIEQLIKEVIVDLLKRFTWKLDRNQDLTYKWLPVSRPKADVTVQFTKYT